MVSSTSARSDSTRPWFTIGLTRQPTSISPHCAYMQMHCVYVCMKIRMKFTRIAKRGRNFTVVATVVSTGITRVGIPITHFDPHGIRKESPSGDSSYGQCGRIRHMAGESQGEHPGVDMSKNKKRIDLSHRVPPLYM